MKLNKFYTALMCYNNHRNLPWNFDNPKYACAYNLTFSPDNKQLWFALEKEQGIHSIDLFTDESKSSY